MLRFLKTVQYKMPRLTGRTYNTATPHTQCLSRLLSYNKPASLNLTFARNLYLNDYPELEQHTLRWGIAPVSLMADDFATSLSVLPPQHHEIVSCVSSQHTEGLEFAEKYGIQHVYSTFDELAMCPYVDCVYISPQNPLHCELCHLMLNHDKHVLCEKPLCMTEQEVSQLLQKAREKNLFLMEGMWPRCVPAYHFLRRQIARNVFGEIYNMYCTLGLPISDSKLKLFGGVTNDLGVYAIQLALWIFREVPERIKTSGALNEDDIDVTANIELIFSRGRRATIVLSAQEVLSNVAIIRGTKGSVKMTNYWCPTAMYDSNDNELVFPLPQIKQRTNYHNRIGMCYEADEVRNCVLNGQTESELFNHNESLLLANITDTIRELLGVGKEVADLERKRVLVEQSKEAENQLARAFVHVADTN